jgi:hypothetical protein
MWKDPIVEETREQRRKIAEQFEFNLTKICFELENKQKNNPKTTSRKPRVPISTTKVA